MRSLPSDYTVGEKQDAFTPCTLCGAGESTALPAILEVLGLQSAEWCLGLRVGMRPIASLLSLAVCNRVVHTPPSVPVYELGVAARQKNSMRRVDGTARGCRRR